MHAECMFAQLERCYTMDTERSLHLKIPSGPSKSLIKVAAAMKLQTRQMHSQSLDVHVSTSTSRACDPATELLTQF